MEPAYNDCIVRDIFCLFISLSIIPYCKNLKKGFETVSKPFN